MICRLSALIAKNAKEKTGIKMSIDCCKNSRNRCSGISCGSICPMGLSRVKPKEQKTAGSGKFFKPSLRRI
jgi:hypothetical protein